MCSGPKITAETPHNDRNVPGERAQAAQVTSRHADRWTRTGKKRSAESAEKVVCVYRLLTVEEKERVQKEEKLNKADKNIALAMEELNNYK